MFEIWKSHATKLGENFAKEQNITSLPVDPVKIAVANDIIVEALPPERKSVSGMLVQNNNNFGIMYATYINNIGFQSFCVGHELGHFMIPGHYEQLLSGGYHESNAGFASREKHELEADHFAAGLLMPTYLFDPALNEVESGLNAIEKLSSQCKTSLTATAIRYAERTPDPIAIILSKEQNIDYCFMSNEMREIRGFDWIKKGTLLPINSVTSRFNKAPQNILNCNRAEGEARLLDWFGCYLHFETYEEVIGLGHYGKTLTVLSLEETPDQEEIDENEELLESWTPRFKR